MIDLSQWRASIGQWNCCQAAASKPTNGNHNFLDHNSSSKVTEDKWLSDRSMSLMEKIFKLTAAILLIVILFFSLLLSRCNYSHFKGSDYCCYSSHYSQVQCTTNDADTAMNWLYSVATADFSKSLFFYLVVCLLLLLSGDVELNPGPPKTNKKRPNPSLVLQKHSKDLANVMTVSLYRITDALYAKELITLDTKINIYSTTGEDESRKAGKLVIGLETLLKASSNPDQFLINICHVLINQQNKTITNIASSMLHQLGNIPSSKELLETHSNVFCDAIASNVICVTEALSNEGLILQQNKREILDKEDKKAMQLINVLQRRLESSPTPDQYLINICHAVMKLQIEALTDIAATILKELGSSIPETVISISPPDEIQHYAHIVRLQHEREPIVAEDWPPRIGRDFFGRLALVEKQSSSEYKKTAWHMLRGEIDVIHTLSGNKKITIDDVLQPDGPWSLRVVIDGPPGIGKTTLCRKLLNMWSNGTFIHQQYDLVLYCPLREIKIAEANNLSDLFVIECNEVPAATKWFEERNGKGLLIIFDGWDELSTELRKSSLAAKIISGKRLCQCSVITTSRTYATSSLLEKSRALSRHVQVIGFSKEEISKVIIQTLDPKLAQERINENKANSSFFETKQNNEGSQLAVKLINNLKVRSDIHSLCYVPLVCSMVILVYRESNELPTTLTELYENFILQTIRRHVKRHEIAEPETLDNLSSLPPQFDEPFKKLCQLAYDNLANNKLTFTINWTTQQELLSEAIKLGLMTMLAEFGKKKYQFFHLTIQEFLAAWWIVKYEDTEEVFRDHFKDEHFRMCLRFIAGLTHLKHEKYQQYFNKPLDLECKKTAFLFNFKNSHFSWFYRNLNIWTGSNNIFNNHVTCDTFDELQLLLIQLLYESQNAALCQLFAESMNNHSLCLTTITSSTLFDMLCFRYFFSNCNKAWNNLDLYKLNGEQLSVFTAGINEQQKDVQKNNSPQSHCKRLEVCLNKTSSDSVQKLLQMPLLHNIQECYCGLQHGYYDHCILLSHFLKLPQIKILYIGMFEFSKFNECTSDRCELEKIIEMKSTLQELTIKYKWQYKNLGFLNAILRGVMQSKTVTSFTLHTDRYETAPIPIPDGTIEQLLKNNTTLKALSLKIPEDLVPSSLNISEVNTPLTALRLGKNKLIASFFPHIRGLNCLVLYQPLNSPQLIHQLHPNLQQLQLMLDTTENAIEFFTNLQSITTLEALCVTIEQEQLFTIWRIGERTIWKEWENSKFCITSIKCMSTSSFLSHLTTYLRYNTSLKQLSIPIPFPSTNKQLISLFEVISEMHTLKELQLDFIFNQPTKRYDTQDSNEEHKIMKALFYGHVIPLIYEMVDSHTTLRLFKIKCGYLNDSTDDFNKFCDLQKSKATSVNETPCTDDTKEVYNYVLLDFLDELSNHPSLEHVEIQRNNRTKGYLTLKDDIMNIYIS